jgi:hypothetical protein
MDGLLTELSKFFDCFEPRVNKEFINFAVVNMMSINQLIYYETGRDDVHNRMTYV